MIDERLPLFNISADVFNSLVFEDVKKTAKDMYDLGILEPPFNNFFIKVKFRFAQNLLSSFYGMHPEATANLRSEFLFKYHFKGELLSVFYYMSKDGRDFFDPQDFGLDMSENSQNMKYFKFIADATFNLLAVLLATKNIKKDVEACNKPNSRNRRERQLSKYSSVTTISIGKITETMRSSGNGGPVRPHLRRGHIRHQHYGKGNAEVKKIFIQPTFINADQGWIDGQREYRVVA